MIIGHLHGTPVSSFLLKVYTRCYAKCLVLLKPRDQLLKIIRREIDVTIKLHDEIKSQVFHEIIPGVERSNNPRSWLTSAICPQRKHSDPWMSGRVRSDDGVRTISGPVIDND